MWVLYGMLFVALAAGTTAVVNIFGLIDVPADPTNVAPGDAEPPSSLLRNLVWIYISGVVGPLGLILAIQRTNTATKQAATAERGERNTRFQTGAQMLGSEVLAVRLGGIYALKALAENDPKAYCGTVTDLLSAFVREPTRDNDYAGSLMMEIRLDVSEVVRALGDKTWRDLMVGSSIESNRINFKKADLKYGNFARLDLSGAEMVQVNFGSAYLDRTNLSGAILPSSNLYQTMMCWADLRSANLNGAKFKDANLEGAAIDGCSIAFSQDLTKAQLAKAKGKPKNVPDNLPDK